MTETGVKHDDGKDRWALLPIKAVREVVKVLTFGAKKYGAWNWLKVENWRERYYDAAMRHVTAWYEGEQNDPESGLHHLAHALCCLIFSLELDRKTGPATLYIPNSPTSPEAPSREPDRPQAGAAKSGEGSGREGASGGTRPFCWGHKDCLRPLMHSERRRLSAEDLPITCYWCAQHVPDSHFSGWCRSRPMDGVVCIFKEPT